MITQIRRICMCYRITISKKSSIIIKTIPNNLDDGPDYPDNIRIRDD